MAITQLSAFLENKPGHLASAIRTISDAGVNIRAMSLADTRDFGVLRLIVSDIEKTKKLLSDISVVIETKVIAVEMTDEAGALSKILKVLEKADINIEYVYAFTGSAACSAYVALRVDDVEHAEAALRAGGIDSLTDEKLMKLL